VDDGGKGYSSYLDGPTRAKLEDAKDDARRIRDEAFFDLLADMVKSSTREEIEALAKGKDKYLRKAAKMIINPPEVSIPIPPITYMRMLQAGITSTIMQAECQKTLKRLYLEIK
jgi:stalled ribosome alternative rescue factor ArfA